MTNAEKTTLFKQWSFVALIIAILGAAAGWGANEAFKSARTDRIEAEVQRHERVLESHSSSIYRADVSLAEIKRDVRYIAERLGAK